MSSSSSATTDSLEARRATSTSPMPSQLENLVAYLVAAKRSLSSIDYVYRANEFVTNTRKALETTTATTARTDFLGCGINQQCKVLSEIQRKTDQSTHRSREELEKAIRSMEAADTRLRDTIESLRRTMVESALRPSDEEEKTLADFVDQGGVTELQSKVRDSMETTSRTENEIISISRSFGEGIQKTRLLVEKPSSEIVTESSRELELTSPVPEILDSMEEGATEMAENLESLVKHLDLCTNAIRHTEGGGKYAQHFTEDIPSELQQDYNKAIVSEESIPEEERCEMIKIIEKDASEVNDVVTEIRDRAEELANYFEVVKTYSRTQAERLDRVIEAYQTLETIGRQLPSYVTQIRILIMRWDDEKAKIDEHVEELEELCSFYANYLAAYDNLLVEVGRRKALENRAERLIQDAIAKVEKMHEDDTEEREAFKESHGHFLPSDLWPQMEHGPLKYSIAKADVSAMGAPNIGKVVLQEALRRARSHVE